MLPKGIQHITKEEIMNIFVDRMIRAAKLSPGLYEEVENDPSSITQAMGVVLLASLAAGIGAISQAGASSLIMGVLTALAGWFIWALLTFYIGTKLLPEPQTRADYGELLRTIGFSSSPGIIRVIGIIPGLVAPVFLIAGIWMLAAMIVAVRQALDYKSTWRAIGVCLIGWVIQALLLFLVFAIFGRPDQVPVE